ncbi:vitellogenin-like [Procambarus clarkii]|uniref:vitellogenin-like n=1 Tax=Procambarus clarkii TaxID=6728 RepID=UPI003743CA85
MTAWAALLVLTILVVVVGARAAPWVGDPNACSVECPVAGSPKLSYQEGKTYIYEYSGKSKVQLKDVEGGLAETDWTARVELWWISPCNMLVSMKDVRIESSSRPNLGNALEKYPLVVAVADGRVQQVCTFPDDDAWSINIKKGIASAFQNSLPSNSSLNSFHNITETDVVGTCPTKYEVQNHGDRVIVKKEKNHRLCKQRYPTPAETQVPWLKGPLPLEESRSVCKQEIRNGIYSSITCEDKNVVRPSYGAYKYIEAKMESTLRYVSVSNDQSNVASSLPQVILRHKSLLYDYDTLKKDPSMVAQLDQTMSEICEKAKDAVERDVAALVAKAAQLLRQVPDEAVEQTLTKVRSGQFCQNYKKLEELFLDAVAFVHESGAVKVMAKELASGHASVERKALYTAALYLLPRPNIYAIAALKPLFESTHPLPLPTLAGASMVNTYCRHNHNCDELAPVKSLAEALGHKLQSQCSPSDDEQTEEAALTTLKALGNMGVMTQEVARSVFRCMETEGVKTNIRVAAAQAFRQTKCHHQQTEHLLNIALHPAKDTEVRIASYLTAVRCANHKDLETIVKKISLEYNTQVRGFILSHLVNLQHTDTPHKQHLRYLMRNILIPRDIRKDMRKYSRNIDVSYFSSALGAGAGVESNIIYSPGSFVPRSVDFNLTAALAGISMNLGEVGARLEGFEPFIEEMFGHESYLQKASFAQILNDIARFVDEKKNKIFDHFQRELRQRRSIDMSTLSNFFHKLYSDDSRVAKADVFARFMGQEISFVSLAGNLKDINPDTIFDTGLLYVNDILYQLKNLKIDSARTAQMYIDYSFPTIQGTPLKLKMEGTTVVGLKMDGKISAKKIFKIIPSLSVQVDGFVGYGNCDTGLEMKNTISSSNGISITVDPQKDNELEFHLDIPDRMDIIDIESKVYLKQLSANPTSRPTVSPESSRNARISLQSCINTLEPVLNLKLCYDINVPDIFRSNAIQLGEPLTAKLSVEKAEPSMKGYIMRAAIENERHSKLIKAKFEVAGSSTPREAQITMSYTTEGEINKVSAKLESPALSSQVWAHVSNKDDHKGVEAFAKYKSGDKEMSQGVKADFKMRSPSSWGEEKEYEVKVYASRSRDFSPQSQVFEWKFTKKANGPETSLDILSRTMNTLRNYINWHLEAGVDLRRSPHSAIAVPSKLRKFEVDGGLGGWKVSSFVRQDSESGHTAKLSSAFKISRRSEDLYYVEATHTTQGTFNQDFVAKTDAKLKLGSSEYKAASIIHFEDQKKGASLQVLRSGDNVKVVDLEALSDFSGQSWNTLVLVDIREYITRIKFESKLAGPGRGHYDLEAALKHGDNVVLMARGPVTAKFSSDSSEFQSDIQLITVTNEPFKIVSRFIFAKNKQLLAFELGKQEQLFSTEWIIKSSSSQGTTVGLKFFLPALVDSKLDAIINQKHIHVSLNTQILPKSSSHRRIKAFTDIDLEAKKWKADLAWDADRDPSKKISLDTVVIISPSHPGSASIQGSVKCMNEMYQVKLDVEAGNMIHYRYGENGFTLELRSPQKTLEWKLNTNVDVKSVEVETDLRYKHQQDREYKLTSVLDIEKLGSPYSYKLESHLSFTNPAGQETTLQTEAKCQIASHKRELYYKATTSTPALTKPLMLELSSECQKNDHYNIKVLTEVDTPETMFIWEAKVSPQEGVETLVSSVDLKAYRDFLNAVLKVVASESGEYHDSPSGEDSKDKYSFKYQKGSPSYSITVESPSRTMKGEAQYSPSESSLRFYPNKAKSEAKYEIAAKSSHSYWDQQSKFEGRISHPSLSKDLRIEVQHSGSGESFRGTIEIDIFPDTADKITGTLQSTGIANNTIKIEASLSTRVLRIHPKVTVMAAYAPHTAGIDLQFQKSPSSPVIFQVSAIYDRVSSRDATMAFRVINERVPVVDIAGTVQREEDPECNGHKVKAVAHISPLGTYDVHSKLCKPIFIGLITRKQGSDKEFITKFGVQSPNNIEVSISVSDIDVPWKTPIGMARVKLANPNDVILHVAYERPEIVMVKNALKEQYRRVMQSFNSWTSRICHYLKQEAQKQGIHFPDPEIVTLVNEIKRDVRQIYHDLIYKDILPQYEAFREFLRRPIPSYIIQLSSNIASGLTKMQNDLRGRLEHEVLAWQEEFKGISDYIIKFLVTGARWAETGSMPESVRHLLEQLENTRIFRMIKSDIDAIIQRYPEEYEATKEIIAKVKLTLQEDFENTLIKISKIPAVENVIKWIIKDLATENAFAKKVAEYFTDKVQCILFGAALETKNNEARFKIELRKPVYSLSQLLKRTHLTPLYYLEKMLMVHDHLLPNPFSKMVWAYHTFLPRHMTEILPPYNRTAMVVSDTEILTFDGTVLRAPPSPCEVVLAAYKSYKLTMAHPQPTALPQIKFSTHSATVIVKPDFRVDVNGREMNRQRQTVGDVTVQKSPHEVNVTSPFLTVRVFREKHVVSVNVSGWTFGHIAGLMGSYDNEVSNDFFTSSGRNASSLKELVASWQEDHQCPTPDISPFNYDTVPIPKIIQCKALMNFQSRCYPLVHHEPFIQMCLASRQPCDAAQAYRTICSSRGVHLMVPPSC